MLTEKQRFDIEDFFSKEIEGGVCKGHNQIFEELVELGIISSQVFKVNENEICCLFDDDWFECSICDWTLPWDASCVADVDEPTCSDCYCEE